MALNQEGLQFRKRGRQTRLLRILSTLFVSFLLAAPTHGSIAGSSPSPAQGAGMLPTAQGVGCPLDLSALRLQSESPGPPGARSAYLLAYCLEQGGRIGETRAMFDAAADRYPPLASYARFRAAAVALRGGDTRGASARLAHLMASGLSRPLAWRAASLRADALTRAGSPADAARMLKAFLQAPSSDPPPDDETFARAWMVLGAAGDALGDRALALRAYAMAWWAVPGNPYAAEAVRRLRQLSGGRLPVPPPEARAQRGIRLLPLGERAAAIAELVAGLRGPLPPAVAARAWFQLGQARLRTMDAVYAFVQATRFPEGTDRARHWLGRALAAVGRSGEARTVWRRVAEEFPRSPWAARSLYRVAVSVESAQGWLAADAILADLTRRFPVSLAADDARWRRGWVRYRLGRFAEAESVLTRAAAEFPSSRRASACLFWAAQARRKTGGNPRPLLERLAHRYPLTYYGQRARAQLRLAAAPPPVEAGLLVLSPDRFHAPHEELAALGFHRDAADEAEALPQAGEDPILQRFIAVQRARSGDVVASVAAGAVGIEEGLYGGSGAARELWMAAYPLAHWESVRAASAARGVDPHLVLALIREESRFDPEVGSPAGAIGLMQLLPSTAAGLAGRKVTREQLRDPDVSIRYGVVYLSEALRTFGGDRLLALA
ncbi:MAG TPA: transglycosylase SLT domain-containing protein, partial [bacterium]|nr:transglycosylase SLT domain-containing protein [bacterium]